MVLVFFTRIFPVKSKNGENKRLIMIDLFILSYGFCCAIYDVFLQNCLAMKIIGMLLFLTVGFCSGIAISKRKTENKGNSSDTQV